MSNSHLLRMPRTWALALPLLAAILTLPQARAQEAGAIERITGNATISNAANQTRPARGGEAVQAGETVTTDNGGEVMLKLKDESLMLLRPNSQLKLTEFRYENKPTDGVFASLFKGTVRAVTGLIGKSRPSSVRLATPTATVGIRGTDFELAIIEQDGSDGRAGTYDYVHSGATSLQIASGQSLDVDPEQTGLALTNPRPGEEPLQLLRDRPAFLRGGGFDALIMQLTQPMQMMPRMR